MAGREFFKLRAGVRFPVSLYGPEQVSIAWQGRQTIHAFELYVSDGIAELEDMLANETKSNGLTTEEVALAA